MRIGILGAGFMGRTHLQSYLGHPLCDSCTVYDSNADKAKALALAFGVNHTTDLQTMLSADMDVLDICLPTFLHKEYVVMAAEAGRHILCEKPMAVSLEECDEIIRAVKNKGVRYMVGHVVRFWPEYKYIKEMVLSGELGKPLYASAARMQPIPAWSENHWIVDPKLSCGGIVDLQIHDLDLMAWLFGMPSTVRTVGNKSVHGAWEQVITVMEHGDGVKTVVDACNLMPEGYPFTARLKVVFTHGCIEYDSNLGNTLAVYREGQKEEHPKLQEEDGYRQETAYFLECVAHGREMTIVRPEDARNALLLALSTRESVERGQTIIIQKQ
ncbi:MAG: Gfo/Idh/MocA family oxidoreductase [Clostridia bacterium]